MNDAIGNNINERLRRVLTTVFSSKFEPDMENAIYALTWFAKLAAELQTLEKLTDEDNLNIDAALWTLAGYINEAYPEFKTTILSMPEEYDDKITNVEDDIDKILSEALANANQADFKPDIECLNNALIKLVFMRFKLKYLNGMTREEDLALNTAFGVVMAHLVNAYPDCKFDLL